MNDFPVPVAPTYTTADRVALVLRDSPYSAHADYAEADKGDVEDWILEAEEEVDKDVQQAWRERRVTQAYYDFPDHADEEGFLAIPLGRPHVRAISALEVWEGSAWVDYIASKTEGRDEDWFLVEDSGLLMISALHGFRGSRRHRVRVTYTYGLSSVPADIRRATTLMAAYLKVTGGVYEEHGHGGPVDRIPRSEASSRWLSQARAILKRHRRLVYA